MMNAAPINSISCVAYIRLEAGSWWFVDMNCERNVHRIELQAVAELVNITTLIQCMCCCVCPVSSV